MGEAKRRREAAAKLATLPVEEQRAVVARGREARLQATATKHRRYAGVTTLPDALVPWPHEPSPAGHRAAIYVCDGFVFAQPADADAPASAALPVRDATGRACDESLFAAEPPGLPRPRRGRRSSVGMRGLLLAVAALGGWGH